MTNFTTTQKLSVASFCLFVVMVFFYVLFYQHISALYTQALEAKAEHVRIVQREDKEQALETLVVETTTLRTRLAERFLTVDNPIPFLALVEKLGDDTGIELEVKSLAEEEDKSEEEVEESDLEDETKSVTARLVLSVSGAWDNMYHFIILLETLPYVAAIENVAIEEKELEGALVWSGQIHLRARIHP